MTFPHGQRANEKNWVLIKRVAMWTIESKKPKDMMGILASEGSEYKERNKFAKFRGQNKKEIAEEIDRLSKEVKERHDITAERVVSELECPAFIDPIDIFNEDGTVKAINDIPEKARRAIASIDVQETFEYDRKNNIKLKTGEIKKIKFWGKPDSLNLLGKNLGMFVDKTKVEINAPELTETLGKLLGATIK